MNGDDKKWSLSRGNAQRVAVRFRLYRVDLVRPLRGRTAERPKRRVAFIGCSDETQVSVVQRQEIDLAFGSKPRRIADQEERPAGELNCLSVRILMASRNQFVGERTQVAT